MSSPWDQTFNINAFNIHTVEGASCVNIGYNFPAGFESYKKHTQGFGSISGDSNKIDGIKSLLNDHSLVDTFSGSDLNESPWIKELIESKMQEVFEDEDLLDDDPFEDDDEDEQDDQGDQVDQGDHPEATKDFNDMDDLEDPSS